MVRKKKSSDWVAYEKEEIKKIIAKLSKEGLTQSQIGLALRDQYGIPTVRKYGEKLGSLVDKAEPGTSLPIPEDLYNLMVRVVNLHSHMNSNKGDAISKYGLEKMESKIRRLGKYYARKGILPKDWKYSIEDVKLLVK